METLKLNPSLKYIKMKYSTAGHGAVQDVDNVHSQIESIKHLRVLLSVEHNADYCKCESKESFLSNANEKSRLLGIC